MYNIKQDDLGAVVNGRDLLCRLRRTVPGLLLSALVCVPGAQAGKVGALKWDETITASLEYNSNITTAEHDPIADLIFQARFAVDGSWEMTQNLVLTYGLGIGYRRYLGNTGFQLDSAAIRLVPDTVFSFDIRVSDQLNFTVSDSVNFMENASDIAVVNRETGEVETNLFSFERVRNRASIDGTWSVNQRNQLGLGVWRTDVIPLSSRFDDYRRIQYGVNGRWTRSFRESLRGGVSGSLYETRYATDFNNDSDGRSWGPFVEWGITENMTFAADMQFVRTGFDRSTAQPGVADDFDYQAVEWGLKLTHAFNPRMSYTLEYRKASDYGYISNYRELDLASAVVAWQATRTGQAYVSVSYEWGDDSGGIAPDYWERWFVAVGYSQPFWKDFEYSVRARWTDKMSRVVGRSYEQYSLYIGLVYHFPSR